MVQSVVSIVQPHMECRKHKNIPLVPLTKNMVAKTDALFTGAVGLQGLQLVSLGVFTAERFRAKPMREATKLCAQHFTGRCCH